MRRMRIALIVLAIASGATMALAASRPNLSELGERWWSHVRYLADDRLQGRQTGSPGHRKAAEYVARQFQAAGARPAGSAGFQQRVPFVARQVDEKRSFLALVRNGRVHALTLGRDANFGMGLESARSIDAQAVFVGYGLAVPEKGYDDLEGLDLRGKVAVALQGGPNSLPGPLRAHAQSTGVRWKHLREAGAIGLVIIPNPGAMDIPWERATLARLYPSMTLDDPELDETRGMKISLRVNPAHADDFFAGSGHRFEDLVKLLDQGKRLPRFALPYKVRARIAYRRWQVESQNVVGLLRGSDPRLRNEFVVVSAHLDHLGVGGAVRGDSIYNGAMDNASGVASLIEIARLAKETGWKPRRSVVLLAVTGEEKGMLGSHWFAERPTVNGSGIVADVNMDMFLPIIPFERMTVFGLDESDLGDWIRPVAKRAGVVVQGDPEPKRNLFIRSDQYSFIRRGVPALAFGFGTRKGSTQDATFKRWIKERYHAPSDDAKQPVNKEGAARYTRLLFDFTRQVVDRDQRPRWKESSFFKRFARERETSDAGRPGERRRSGT